MHNSGFSILECMIVIVIAAFSYIIAIPNLQHFGHVYVGTTLIHEVQQILHYARSLALAQQHNVIICPSSNGVNCNAIWDHGILVIGKNTRQYFRLTTGSGFLTLQQSGNSNKKIEILPNGMIYVNGHFNYKNGQDKCWPEFSLYFNRALRSYIIINS